MPNLSYLGLFVIMLLLVMQVAAGFLIDIFIGILIMAIAAGIIYNKQGGR